MSYFKRLWWYRGILWLVLMALVVSPAAAEVATGSQPVPAAKNTGGPFIYLVADTFDPLQRQPDLPEALVNEAAAVEIDGAYLVQFTGPVLQEWVQALEAQGAQVGPYIPDYAFIVRLDASSKPKVERLSFVRWVGPFEPAYRISPRAAGLELNSYRVILLPWADVAAVSRGLSGFAQEMPGAARVQQYAADGLSVVLDPAGVLQAARLPGVLWVEPIELNELYNDVAGGILNAPTAYALGLDGSGVKVGVADTGLDVTHGDFDDRVVKTKSYPVLEAYYGSCLVSNPGDDDDIADLNSGHGTHVTGSLTGSGYRSGGTFKGLAYDASVTFQAVEQWTTFSPVSCEENNGYYLSGIPLDVGVLLDDAHAWGVRVHNNSWGSNSSGAYQENAANFDQRIHQFGDLLVTVAAGNYGRDGSPLVTNDEDGYVDLDSISSLGTAKNVLTVGAVDNERLLGGYGSFTWYFLVYKEYYPTKVIHYFPLPPTADDLVADSRTELAAFSSRGPTDDGRIKPDLVTPGTNIVSTLAQGELYIPTPGWGIYELEPDPAKPEYYMYNGGTSMSSPLAAGAAALVREYYMEQMLVANPSAALVKATLINTAVDITGYAYAGKEAALPIPNPHEGWGRIDVGAAVTTGARQFIDDWTGLATGELQQWTFSVASGQPFKVTLVWSDKEATLPASNTLVNNLDLEVTAPDGTTMYRGNDFSGGWSVAGGDGDAINNVENVYIQLPTPGVWQVKVKGTNIPAAIPADTQAFALVVDGNITQLPPQVDSIAPNTGLNTQPLEGALISGNYLLGATGVWLVKDTETIAGTITAGNLTQLQADFNLAGKTAGVYDLKVTTPFGTGTLQDAFNVLDASLPDLKLTLEPVKLSFVDGEPVTFTLHIENDPLNLAPGVIFTQTFPAGISLLDVSPACTTETTLADGYSCAIGNLAAGAAVTYQVTAEADQALEGAFTSQAVVRMAVPDRWEADNTDLAAFLLDLFFLYMPVVVK